MTFSLPIDPTLVKELAERFPTAESEADARQQAVDAAALLRSIFAEHPKQAAFYRRNPAAPLRATTKTRRAGATVGGVREFLARAIEQAGFRGTYATTTRQEAIDRAWANDTHSGFADILRELGEPVEPADVETVTFGGVTIELRIGDVALEFSNGSRIDLYGAENMRALKRKRGNAKHVFWVDEAQDFPFLDVFYKSVVVAALTDYSGECWLTGTPGRDCAGFFYDVTGSEEGVAGWEVHAIAAVDNPFFGTVVQTDTEWFVDDNLGVRHGPYDSRSAADDAARAIRWENAAGAAIRLNNFTEDDPDVQRELFGKWVKTGARFVYPVHGVPDHVLLFAPQRTRENTFRAGHPAWYDHAAALADLPWNRKLGRPYQWMFSIGADFGYHPDPFALVLWAFTHEHPDVFEMFSWKQTEVNTDDQAAYMKMLLDAVPEVVSFVGDVDGKQDDVDVWVNRMGLPIEPARKHGKAMLEELLAGDIRKHRVHLRSGSPLHTEMRHLVYLPTVPGKPRVVDKRRKVAGVVHGDHCCDAGRYAYADLTHFLHRPEPGREGISEIERLRREAERFERQVDDRDVKAQRSREEEDLEARWGPGDGSRFAIGGYDGYGYE